MNSSVNNPNESICTSKYKKDDENKNKKKD